MIRIAYSFFFFADFIIKKDEFLELFFVSRFRNGTVSVRRQMYNKKDRMRFSQTTPIFVFFLLSSHPYCRKAASSSPQMMPDVPPDPVIFLKKAVAELFSDKRLSEYNRFMQTFQHRLLMLEADTFRHFPSATRQLTVGISGYARRHLPVRSRCGSVLLTGSCLLCF